MSCPRTHVRLILHDHPFPLTCSGANINHLTNVDTTKHLYHQLQYYFQEQQHKRAQILSEKTHLLQVLAFKPFTYYYFNNCQWYENRNDPEIFSQVLSTDGLLLEIFAYKIKFLNPKTQQQLCLNAVRENGEALEFVQEEQLDLEIIEEASREDGASLRHIMDSELFTSLSHKAFLHAVQSNGSALCYTKYKNDEDVYITLNRDLLEAAVLEDPLVLEFSKFRPHPERHASLCYLYEYAFMFFPFLFFDPEMVYYCRGNMKAIQTVLTSSPEGYGYMSDDLSRRLEWIELAARENDVSILFENQQAQFAVSHQQDSNQDSKSTVHEKETTSHYYLNHAYGRVISKCGQALYFAPKEHKNDFQVVMAAVQSDGMALEYASDELKNNQEIVWQAVKENPQALVFASDDLYFHNRKFVLKLVSEFGDAFPYLSDDFKQDREIVLAAVSQWGEAFEHIPKKSSLKKDRQVILRAVSNCGQVLRLLKGTNFQNDKEVVLKAVRNDGTAIKYASKTMRQDEQIVREAIQQNPYAILHASSKVRNGHEMAKLCIQQQPSLYGEHDSSELISNENRELALEAVRACGQNLVHVSETLKQDREVVLHAVRHNGLSLQHASPEMQDDDEIALVAVSENGMALEYVSKRLRNSLKHVLRALNTEEQFEKTWTHYWDTELEDLFEQTHVLKRKIDQVRSDNFDSSTMERTDENNDKNQGHKRKKII